MTPATPTPPRLARWLLTRALSGRVRSAIVGDLDEEFARFVAPGLGARAARRWYWRQTVASIGACLREPAVQELEPAEQLTLRGALMDDRRGFTNDVRAAMRFCWRSPVLAITVVLTLAFGIGATTAIFSVLNASFLKKLPIAHADRLVAIEAKGGGSFSYQDYLALADVPGLQSVIAGGRLSTTMASFGSPSSSAAVQPRRRVAVDLVTANYFDALGVAPAPRGRLFVDADGRADASPVAVLSDHGWRTLFNADRDVVGRTIQLHRSAFTIIGVVPAGFSGLQIGYSPDFWVPMAHGALIDSNVRLLEATSAWLGLAGILERPDTLAAATTAIDGRWQASGRSDSSVLRLMPRGRQWYRPAPESRLRLFALFAVLVVLICTLNVSTLLGTTVHARQKELAIRASLGAGRLRLLRQLFAEHLLLAVGGGLLGGLLGTWMARALAPLMASRFMPADLDVSADARVVLFTMAMSAVVGAAIAVMPAVRWSRVNTLTALQNGTPSLVGRTSSRGAWWLIPGQVAISTVLLASAVLLVRTVQELKVGIQASAPERVWFADVAFDSLLKAGTRLEDFQQQFPLHLKTLPGVEESGLGSGRPLVSMRRGPLRVEGMTNVPTTRFNTWGPPPPPPPRGTPMAAVQKMWIVSHNYVTPGYFGALALPMVQGRDFTASDRANAPRVAIVNETLASRAFGKANPVGRRLSFGPPGPFDIEIVGVVRDLRYEHLREAAPDGLFMPVAQIPRGQNEDITVTGRMQPINLTVVLRMAEGQSMSREALVQHALRFDPGLFIDKIWTFDEEANGALGQERLLASLGTLLGAAALALLVIGLYGTMSAAVIRSRRELGIRLAIGASPWRLRRMVVTRSIFIVLTGLVLGLPLAYAATQSFRHLLYGVQPLDPIVLGVTTVAVLVTGVIAAYVPARRAARVDPVIALRAE